MTQINSWAECKYYIKADLYRYRKSVTFKSFVRGYYSPGFRYTFWLRLCQWSKHTKKIFFFLIARIFLRHYSIQYGIIIPYQATIGSGLYIGHFSCIVVSHLAIIGKNVNLSQGITIGQKNGGTRSGAPYIGDMVYMGTGAKVIGNVVVGNRAAIGANSVVIKDIPENAIVSGIPASILSYEGSYNYVGGFFDEEKYEKRIIKKEEITRNGGK